MQILTYNQTEGYDRIRVRFVHFESEGEPYVTVVHEKMLGDKVLADSRQQFRAEDVEFPTEMRYKLLLELTSNFDPKAAAIIEQALDMKIERIMQGDAK